MTDTSEKPDDIEWCGSCFSELGTEDSCLSCQMRRDKYI